MRPSKVSYDPSGQAGKLYSEFRVTEAGGKVYVPAGETPAGTGYQLSAENVQIVGRRAVPASSSRKAPTQSYLEALSEPPPPPPVRSSHDKSLKGHVQGPVAEKKEKAPSPQAGAPVKGDPAQVKPPPDAIDPRKAPGAEVNQIMGYIERGAKVGEPEKGLFGDSTAMVFCFVFGALVLFALFGGRARTPAVPPPPPAAALELPPPVPIPGPPLAELAELAP